MVSLATLIVRFVSAGHLLEPGNWASFHVRLDVLANSCELPSRSGNWRHSIESRRTVSIIFHCRWGIPVRFLADYPLRFHEVRTITHAVNNVSIRKRFLCIGFLHVTDAIIQSLEHLCDIGRRFSAYRPVSLRNAITWPPIEKS